MLEKVGWRGERWRMRLVKWLGSSVSFLKQKLNPISRKRVLSLPLHQISTDWPLMGHSGSLESRKGLFDDLTGPFFQI